MMRFLDDIFILIGCLLILVGVYQVNPLLVWFVSGVMFLIAGILIGLGKTDGEKRGKQ
jgi:hypothetical membrane protein